MASLKRVHDIYGKHVQGNVVWHMGEDKLTQCTCGTWLCLAIDGGKEKWAPLVGHSAARWINENPTLYPLLREYIIENQGRKVIVDGIEDAIVPWTSVVLNVDPKIVKRYARKEVA